MGGVTRRRFLQIGGTLSMSAVLAACIGGGSTKRSRDSSGGARGREADATIVRTLSSVETAAVVVYTRVIDAGLLSTPVPSELGLFRSHHQEHAELFRRTTADLGGRPFTDPNPVVMQQLEPGLDTLGDEATALRVVFDVETILADTYQATMGTFADKSFNVAAMSVGGAEARHAAAIAPSIGLSPAPQALASPDQAVPAGNGV